MSLQVPTYANPYSSSPITNAYAWIGFLGIDFTTGQGRVQVVVNVNAADADAEFPPIDQFSVALGDVLVPGNPAATPPTSDLTFPTLTQLTVSAASLASAANPPLDPFSGMHAALYAALLNHPKLVGSTLVA